MWNVLFLISGFLFLILLAVIFYSKPTIDSKENRIFKLFVSANIVEYLIEIPLQIVTRNIGIDNLFATIFTRLYILSIFIVFSIFEFIYFTSTY